jgi:hypothetical protein
MNRHSGHPDNTSRPSKAMPEPDENFRTGSRAHCDKTTGLRSINWPLEIFWLMIYCRIWRLYPCGIEFLCHGALIPEPDMLYPTLISDFSPGVSDKYSNLMPQIEPRRLTPNDCSLQRLLGLALPANRTHRPH